MRKNTKPQQNIKQVQRDMNYLEFSIFKLPKKKMITQTLAVLVLGAWIFTTEIKKRRNEETLCGGCLPSLIPLTANRKKDWWFE